MGPNIREDHGNRHSRLGGFAPPRRDMLPSPPPRSAPPPGREERQRERGRREPPSPVPTQQPVDKIPPAFERRRIRAGRFASPVRTVKYTLHYVMSAIHFATPRLRSALLLGRIAPLFPLRRALPARRLARSRCSGGFVHGLPGIPLEPPLPRPLRLVPAVSPGDQVVPRAGGGVEKFGALPEIRRHPPQTRRQRVPGRCTPGRGRRRRPVGTSWAARAQPRERRRACRPPRRRHWLRTPGGTSRPYRSSARRKRPPRAGPPVRFARRERGQRKENRRRSHRRSPLSGWR